MAAWGAGRRSVRVRPPGGAIESCRGSGRAIDFEAGVDCPQTVAGGQAVFFLRPVATGLESDSLRLGASIHRSGMCVEVIAVTSSTSILKEKSGPRAAL